MANMKRLCMISIASLAATMAAHAADLPPPPQFEVAPPPPVLGGNWYLRGDAGLGIADLRTRASSFDYTVPDARYEAHSLDDSAFIDAGVGYRFSNYFRADVTGEYRAAAHYSAIESYNQGYYNYPPDGSRGYDTYSGSIRSVVGLVNGYVDAGTWYGATPFIGAGVGVANVRVSNLVDLSPGGGFGIAGDRGRTNFAFALMAGIDVAITPTLALELGYRYLDLGNARSGAIACAQEIPCPGEVQHYHVASNDIRIGFRYTFADFAPPPPPLLVRRY